jgi:hypothetical protein
MKRQFPNTTVESDHSAYTMIWPHSRLELDGQRPRRGASGRIALTPVRPRGLGHRAASGRPILRQELFDALCKRMADLLRKTMTWA